MYKMLVAAVALLLAAAPGAMARELVILHTNDTHSQIDPLADGTGGIARRKALIDSVRAARPNVMLVDAGDAVQGTLFFNLFRGEVEQKMLNALGYDIQILGNHEFDNGVGELASRLAIATPMLLASNYDMRGTALEGMFRPYTVKTVDGHRVGFFAININPEGLIESKRIEGVRYLDAFEAAQAMAWYLRNVEHCDKVVAITHIGYDDINGVNDRELAARSRDIDIIIGGHSHTLIDPATPDARIPNAAGDTVLVVQTRNRGSYLGEIDIDLATGKTVGKLLTVDSRLDSRADPAIEEILAPYRHAVDSILGKRVGKAAVDLTVGQPVTLNWLSDYVLDRGRELAGRKVDIAIMNKGGIRNSIPRGTVTKGQIMTMLPFTNHIVVMELSGADLLENLAVMGRQDGNGVSRGVDVTYRPGSGEIVSATIDGQPIDADRTYTVATISYLATGGDYMTPLTRGRIIAESDAVIYDDVISSMEHGFLKGKALAAPADRRMHPAR